MEQTKIQHPVMRYHGGKYRLAPWIMSFFPDHYTYVEPFGGAAGVLLQKPRSMSEVYNDLDGDVVNVFRVLQDRDLADDLRRRLVVTPYARAEFDISYESTDDQVEQARRTLIRAHQGFGSAGATKHKTGFRIDSAREYGTAAHLWAKYPNQIASFVERMQSVVIENKPAIEVIDNHDRTNTLYFVDPPYMHSTRRMRAGGYYNHEMTDDDHVQLLDVLNQVSGMVVLSGYDSEIYNDMLSSWTRHTTSARISAGRGTAIRTEVVWLNPACSQGQAQTSLFV
ncbi:MAG: DNA adenine methylase [Candidatus Thiodiazotropha lotti]|nr:DNA adenine methylase [Candidatus Thiodiazotropha lotti]MCW4222808.1 DNA adenine methylase [Candidatus Thiodiazotropha lotti]